jgi:two-component system response regulator (stage 0 sporulation protein F)
MERVLVVDDQMGIRVLLKEILEEEGYITDVAESGAEALSFLKNSHPQIVLLDMSMPLMDGLEVLKEMKGMASEARVIMMTAYGEAEYAAKARELGAYAYVTKPFDIVRLCDMVAMACGRKSAVRQ